MGRHQAVNVRRRRAIAVTLAVALVAVVAWLAARPDGGASHDAASRGGAADARPTAVRPSHDKAAPLSLPAAESGLLPWHLAEPLSREVVAAGSQGQLIVLGGLTAGSASADGVYAVRAATGATRQIGRLTAPLHDAAAAVSGGRALLFGGGSPGTVGTVQSFPLPGGGSPATEVGSLPAPRSDAQAVTIGATTYLVGGYDGSKPDAWVLATTNGRAYLKVAALPVPVRYPAVAALGGRIYAFGGQAITGPHAGAPVSVIQAVDPAARTAAIIGDLPEPLLGAVAVTVHGELFVAGGESPAARHPAPGLGTTQLAGQPTASSGTGVSSSPTQTVSTIWAYDPASRRLLTAGRLQVPVSHAAVAVKGSTAWVVGGESDGTMVASVQMIRPDRAFGTAGAPGAGSPFFGARLLIADRGNNRLLLLDPALHVVWKYPSAAQRDQPRFYFPDDAFFTDHGTAIISNQEENETIIKLAYPSGKIIWSYGHPGRTGTARGYLHEPDDAYLLKDGQVAVADAINCRVLVINENRTVAHQIGSSGVCVHNPPASMGSPNGDTPLSDGNLLVSEINGSWVSEYTLTGRLVWTVRLPVVSYPSDPQQLGPDRYLLADYSSPGQILEFNRKGKILYRYHQASGPGMLNHPSLTELLPSGVFMTNDDYNDRMVAIDPATGALVWQYGITGQPGTGPGQLNTPDGFDLLLPDGSTPTHLATG